MVSVNSLAKRDMMISNYFINFTKKNRGALNQLVTSLEITLRNKVGKLLNRLL